ncbi:hypothetical protein [Streptomyces sp. H27-C3]|uniref:hypothetical protein n=1 Tax=Streptomyces sp. H27-C3 TaxID=3046305 RepID=UPI0024B8BDB6|nr:hypothetical protein [Streptomyces sp. H27-C3]MDJ0466582.1 hypothetical protein [Streptomyces sp. H27-C3]
MTTSGGSAHPAIHEAEAFVRDWHRRLAAREETDELFATLANGIRLETPTAILRGPHEFRTWYDAGQHEPLADPRITGAVWEVTVTSPMHIQLTLTLPDADGTGAAGRQEWWVVRQDGGLRVRTIVVTSVVPQPVAMVAEPAFV